MAHFYGKVNGQAKTEATRRGSKNTGLTTVAASWKGAIRTELYVDDEGDDAFRIYEQQWHGNGIDRVIAEGKLGKAMS